MWCDSTVERLYRLTASRQTAYLHAGGGLSLSDRVPAFRAGHGAVELRTTLSDSDLKSVQVFPR